MRAWPTSVELATPLTTYFAQTEESALAIKERPALVVVPGQSTFNNFGRYFWADMMVLRQGHSPFHLPAMLMFADTVNSTKYLDEYFGRSSGRWIRTNDVARRFITIFSEADGYARLVDILGFDTAVATLRALGDAVVLKDEQDDERAELLDTVAFHEGVLRDQKTYTAFRQGSRHLRPYAPRTKQDARATIALTARLPGTFAPVNAVIDFESDALMRDRLAVLIGRNGVGKTQLLLSMIEGLRLHPESRDHSFHSPADFTLPPDLSRLIVFSSVSGDPYPRQIPSWSGLDYEYLSLVPQPLLGSRSLLAALLDCTRDSPERPFRYRGEHLDRYGLLKILLRRLGFWEELHVPVRPPKSDDVFSSAATVDGGRYVRLSMNLGEQRAIRLVAEADDARDVALFDGDGRIRQLSSGESAMLRFAIQMVASIEFGSLLVLEEPESHLHPHFVSEMMAILHDILEATGSVALAITHSAYVVREAARERVNVLRDTPDEGRELAPAPLQTFGASVDSISQFVFGDTEISHQFQTTLRLWLESKPDMTLMDLRDYASDLNPETMAFLVRLLRRRGDALETENGL